MSAPADPRAGPERPNYGDVGARLDAILDVRHRTDGELRALAEAYRGWLAEAEAVVADLAGIVRVIEGALSDRPLRGRELATFAVETLRASVRGDGEIHYTDWFAMVSERRTVGGKDPAATFLTAITRDERIVRTGANRSGLYRLRDPKGER